MPGTLVGGTSGAVCSFLECISIFEGSDLKYKSTASLFHLPSVLISSHEMPAATAEIAAPLRRGCQEKLVGWILASREHFRFVWMRSFVEKERRFLEING